MIVEQSKQIIAEVNKAFIGKNDIIEKVLMTIYTGGHVLLQDCPGVGKTTLALAFSKVLGLSSRRIQFTPDTLPSDITGFTVFNRETNRFEYRDGAANCQLLLADEINRTSPKTQSALLEVMEERTITVDGETHQLPAPFICIATQNPLGFSGTQPLPESQLDRFMVCLSIGYPTLENQLKIIQAQRYTNPLLEMQPVTNAQNVIEVQNYLNSVRMTDAVLWKLSGKADHLIMRQPSEPTHYHAIILMDLGMEQDGQSVTRTELNGAAAVGAALCQEMIQQGAAFCVALPYKDELSVNEIGSMREFQKIQMEWLGMPVQMNAGRGMDYFVLQHMEEHFTRLIIISAGRYSKDIVSLAQRIGVTVLSIVEDAGSTAGIVCSMLAHRLKDKYQLSVLILLAPWPAAFVLTSFRGCFEGLKAWINLMITQWNKVHEDSVALLSGNIVQHDLWASTVVIALLCGEVTYFLITLRKYGFCALYCILWVMVQLFSSAFSPAACIGLFVPVVAVCISNQRTEMTHRGLLWVAGLTAVLVICAVAVPQEDMLSMAKAKSALKLSLSNMRYGQPTLPEGHVDEADQLKANENEMFTVTSEQKKIFISKAIQADDI